MEESGCQIVEFHPLFRTQIVHDLFQIGCIGLCKAAATDRGGNFSTYAYRLIWNEICSALVHATKRQETELKILDNPGQSRSWRCV